MEAVNHRILLEAGWFFNLWVVFFNVEDDGKDKEPTDFGFKRSSRTRKTLELITCSCESCNSVTDIFSTVIPSHFFHKKGQIPCFLSIHGEMRGCTQCILVFSVGNAVHAVSTITVITTIAGELFPYDCYNRHIC